MHNGQSEETEYGPLKGVFVVHRVLQLNWFAADYKLKVWEQ